MLVVYELGSSTATPIAIDGSPLKQILVATQSTQPFPGLCLSGISYFQLKLFLYFSILMYFLSERCFLLCIFAFMMSDHLTDR